LEQRADLRVRPVRRNNHRRIRRGNATPHLNHACEPNCKAFEYDAKDGSIRLVIETIRPIAPGDELMLDYALQIGDDDPPDYPCACRASTCRDTLAEVVKG
jgi:uncharacterized protein